MDFLNISVLVLTICVNIALFFLGKYYGSKEGYEAGWKDGANDQTIMEVSLRNKVNDLEETIKRLTIDPIGVPKKRGRSRKS